MQHKEDHKSHAATENKERSSRKGWENWLSTITKNQPLLTAEEEILLGRQVQAMMKLLQQIKEEGRTEPAKGAERACVRRGKKAKDRFILGNVLLVKKVAIKFTGRTRMPVEDLFQDGLIGLNRAAEKFDPERGYKFSTYAFWWIRQSMARAIGIQEYSIRLPGHYHEVMCRVRQFVREYEQLHSRRPSFDEIYEISGTKSKETFRAFMDRSAGVVSLSHGMAGGKTAMIDQIVSSTAKNPYDIISLSDSVQHVQIAVNNLQDPIQKRIMLNEIQEDPDTLTALCSELNVSRESVRNKKKLAMNILRHQLRHRV